MKTITGTISANLASYHTTDSISQMDPNQALGHLIFSNHAIDGWMKIGTAQITITLDDNKTIVANQIEVLKQAKKKIQADTQAKLTAIDEQIGNLLCLEHKPATEVEASHERSQ